MLPVGDGKVSGLVGATTGEEDLDEDADGEVLARYPVADPVGHAQSAAYEGLDFV
jgi:hypothetical protein